jgi:hypothetical protein
MSLLLKLSSSLYSLSLICVALLCLQYTQAFEIDVVVGSNLTVSGVNVTGQDSHPITSSETSSFGLTDDFLKTEIAKIMDGKRPDDVALSGPAYAKFGWEPVQTVLNAKSAEITSVSTKPVLLKNVTLINQSSQKGTFWADTTETVQNSVQSSWSQSTIINATQTITYGFNFLGINVGGQSYFSYQGEWQKGGSNTETVTLGSSEGVSVELQPGQQVHVILSASQGVMNLKVNFEADLTGQVYFHYNQRWQGHYFWACDVHDLPVQSITISEDIQVSFYSDAIVKLIDAATGEIIGVGAANGVEDLIFA